MYERKGSTPRTCLVVVIPSISISMVSSGYTKDKSFCNTTSPTNLKRIQNKGVPGVANCCLHSYFKTQSCRRQNKNGTLFKISYSKKADLKYPIVRYKKGPTAPFLNAQSAAYVTFSLINIFKWI